MSDPLVPIDQSERRRKVLHGMEAALSKARMDAEAIECTTLAYFIDMAIAEVKNGLRSDQEGTASYFVPQSLKDS